MLMHFKLLYKWCQTPGKLIIEGFGAMCCHILFAVMMKGNLEGWVVGERKKLICSKVLK